MTENEIALNSEFARLDDALRNFNIFDALSVQTQEIRHSAFLGFLLNPNQTHGFGTKFLTEFLRLCSAKLSDSIPLLDLNLSLTKLTFEKRFHNNKSLDLLIEIPYAINNESCVIAIEHKIFSNERDGQLKDYTDGLRHYLGGDGNLHKIYLTMRGDDPGDESWVGVTHGEVVLPAVEALLQNSEDMLSDYFIQVMKDYIDTISQESDASTDADDLIASMDREVVDAIQRDDGRLKRIPILFPRAWRYLKNLESDPRASVLKWFKSPGVIDKSFVIESSNRNYLRLSFLSVENRDNLIRICDHPPKSWLTSHAHLALELVLSIDQNNNMSGQVKLVLGPTNADFYSRQELFNCLRGRDNNGKEVALYWSRIKPAELIPNVGKVEFNSLDPNQTQEWIKKNFVGLGNQVREVVNDRLKSFFAANPSLT